MTTNGFRRAERRRGSVEELTDAPAERERHGEKRERDNRSHSAGPIGMGVEPGHLVSLSAPGG